MWKLGSNPPVEHCTPELATPLTVAVGTLHEIPVYVPGYAPLLMTWLKPMGKTGPVVFQPAVRLATGTPNTSSVELPSAVPPLFTPMLGKFAPLGTKGARFPKVVVFVKRPTAARTTVLPLPLTSQATPKRGAKSDLLPV